MRRIVVNEHITMDGVVQAPGGPEEDTSNGFAFGGWIAPFSDPTLGTALRNQMNLPFDLLLGRTTFEIWETYWPRHTDIWPGVQTATKYVASNTRTSSEWKESVFLKGDVVTEVRRLKQQTGPDLHVWGSSLLLQTLIKHDLVDVFWLISYPITLGHGKRLFASGTIPAAFRVTECHVSPIGVLIIQYERSGAIATGRL
jgi:dihydrofolate reductase